MENDNPFAHFVEVKSLFERITELEKENLSLKFEKERLQSDLRYANAFAENDALAYPEIV